MEGTSIYEGLIAENPNTGKVYLVGGEQHVVIDLNEELAQHRGENVVIKVTPAPTKES